MREQLGGAQPRSRVNPPPRHLLWGPNTIEAGTRFAGACGFISIPPPFILYVAQHLQHNSNLQVSG